MDQLHNVTDHSSRRAPNVLAISGSLRSASFSTAILQAICHANLPGITIALKTLEDIPLYNEDLDTDPAPSAVAELRNEVRVSDGVVIATPEYNHGIPGVLKNALDWASRPAFASCFRGKPVLIITSASGGTGGVRAQYQLRETLASMLARIVPGREILLAGIENRVRHGRFTDATTLGVITTGIDGLLREITSMPAQQGNI